MTFTATLSSAALAAAAARIAALTDNRITIPIMENVLLRFDQGALVIAGSNIDQSLTVRVEADGEGACTVNAARLSAAAARLERAEPVTLKLDGTSLGITQRCARWKLPTLNVADYPASLVEPLAGAAAWELDAAPLLALLRRVEDAATRDSPSKPYLCGIRFDLESGALAATDGNTLAIAALGDCAPPKKVKAPSFTLPIQAVKPLSDLLKQSGRISIAVTDKAVSFSAINEGPESECLRSQVIDGDWPDYRRIVPDARANRFEIHAAELARAISRASVVEGDVRMVNKAKIRINRLDLAFAEEELSVRSHNMTGEEAADACPARRLAGADTSIFLRTEYFAAAIASFGEAATLEIGIEDAGSPIVITRAGDAQRAHLRVIMPMRG